MRALGAWLAGAVCVLLAAVPLLGHAQPFAAANVDLRGWDFERSGITFLDGTWEFVPQRLVAPSEAWPADAMRMKVPDEWNAQLGGGRAYGTYRVHVACAGAQPLALYLPFEHSSAKYFLNGRPFAQQGSPAASREAYRPSVMQQIVPLPTGACPFTLLVQVANFDVYRGGMVRSIQIGTPAQLAERRASTLVLGQTTTGALLFAAFFAVLFFAWRPREPAPLFFGMFALTNAISLGLAGERPMISSIEALGFHPLIRVLFLNWFAGLASFPWLLKRLYPTHAWRPATLGFTVFSIAGALLVLATPTPIFSYTSPALIVAAVLEAVYLAVVLARAIRHGERGAIVLLVGLLAFIAATAHDIILFERLLSSSLLPYGVLAFVMAPAVLLAQRFAQSLALEELRGIEQRGRTDMLVRATQAGIVDRDMVRNTVTYSDRYKEMLGYTPDTPDMRLPRFEEMLHTDDREAVLAATLARLRDRSVRNGLQQHEPKDFRLRRSDGTFVWVHAEAVGVCGADGRTLRFIGSFIDISASKGHELAMSNRIKFINDLFDSMPLALALRDPAGRYLLVNRAWERYFGLTRESVVGTSLADVDAPAARAALELDRTALALGPGVQGPDHEYDYNGRRLVQTRSVMIDSQGARIGVLTTSLDITEKHAIAQALVTERERLRLLVRSTRAGFGDWDAENDVVQYTDRFKEMLGYPADYDTSQWPSLFDMMHPEDRERAREEFRLMIRRKPTGGEQVPGQPMSYRLQRRDGGWIWIHAEGISLVDDQGRTRRFITSYLDFTHFHEQEEALRASRDQIAAQARLLERQNETLKENVRLREEVERIGRHDIKTPLNSIVAVPRLLREERRLGPEADELLGIVERAGYRILSMVNLSLDLYKMEQGNYVFRPDAVDLIDLAGKVIADVRVHAESKRVVVRQTVRRLPFAWAEELLCYSLLANLLKNAVEASPEGAQVWVRAESSGDHVLVRIHNEGAVPVAIRESFFQKYASLGKASGTGLGTYSARLMARVQDGEVSMETSNEGGTTLTVRLRAAPEGAMPATTRHANERRGVDPVLLASLPPSRVLLVDDDEYNLLIVRRFLPTPPFTVETAINGRVALAAAQARWPDLVFMDLDMPVMGGMEAVRELRALQAANGGSPCCIVALSSHDDEATRTQALGAGFDRYLSKPVTRELIQETLLALRAAPPAEPVRSAPAGAPGAQHVPGADDPITIDPDIRPMLGDFIASRRQLVSGLSAAMRVLDREEVRRIAHQLAGSFALYGFTWAGQQARWLELNAQVVGPERLHQVADGLDAHLGQAHAQLIGGDMIDLPQQPSPGELR